MPRLIQSIMPLIAVVVILAACNTGKAAHGPERGAIQKKRVFVRGHLTGTDEIQQVITWQTLNSPSRSRPYASAHLAIETQGTKRRIIWQTDGGDSYTEVNSVRAVDLDGDGLPEISSLWWQGASMGAALRIFHWDRGTKSFAELRSETDLKGIHRYTIAPRKNGTVGARRLIVYVQSDIGAGRPPVPGGEYEVQGSALVRVGRAAKGSDMGEEKKGESGIEGETVLGPARPGVLRDNAGPDIVPYETSLLILSSSGEREVTRVRSGSDGRFRVSLAPGDYIVRPVSDQPKRWPRGEEQLVTVTAGKYTHVTIRFDSGMR